MSRPRQSDLNTVIAANLRFFMARSPDCQNAAQLANKTKGAVSSSTVQNYLDPKQRTTSNKKANGYPTVDKLAVLAGCLNAQVWELLHPDIAGFRKQQALVKAIDDLRIANEEISFQERHPAKNRKGKVA